MNVHRLRRAASGFVILAGVVAPLSACGGEHPAAAAPVVEVSLGHYTISPAQLSVTAGRVALHVTNTDSMAHNLTVAGRGTRNLAPGESQTLEVTFDAGQTKMWCDVPGHAAMGQTGMVIATPAPAA